MSKSSRQYLLLVAFFIILLITGFILFKAGGLFVKKETETGSALIRPGYLNTPIPKIDKIKTMINNPKFQELKYVKSFFEPVEKVDSGKPNPFMPFEVKQEK